MKNDRRDNGSTVLNSQDNYTITRPNPSRYRYDDLPLLFWRPECIEFPYEETFILKQKSTAASRTEIAVLHVFIKVIGNKLQ